MNDAIRSILSVYDMNGTVVRNRLAVAPMTRVSATEEGRPDQRRAGSNIMAEDIWLTRKDQGFKTGRRKAKNRGGRPIDCSR